ncbi:putative inactive methylesterase 20 [Elaeis guineensis]|uniref:putative inactive methylesterase 20 n=1 Tax=Elaeis guineensis var. tenera TaxID=51953 RepID=UPI003C6CF7B2
MEEGGRRQKHIILVHGACHGAWSWYRVATLLRCAGHQVTVPDLAASGIDERRLHEVSTFADYSQPLLDILAALPPGERVILVGHSLGGMSVSLAMERFPERIAAAVFLTAFHAGSRFPAVPRPRQVEILDCPRQPFHLNRERLKSNGTITAYLARLKTNLYAI